MVLILALWCQMVSWNLTFSHVMTVICHLCMCKLSLRSGQFCMNHAADDFYKMCRAFDQNIVDEIGNWSWNWYITKAIKFISHIYLLCKMFFVVRRAGLLWSQQDFEWRWSVPLFKCLTVLEFSFILFDLCLLITFFNFIMNYVPIVTFWIFTYHNIWILSIMFCFIWSYWIIYFLACLEVSWRVVS